MTIVGRPKKDKSLRILCIFVLIRISVTSRFPFWQLRPRSEYLHRNGRDVAINGALCRSGRRQIIGKPIVKFPDLTRGCPKKDCFKLFLRVVVEQAMQWVDRVPIWLPALGGLGNQTMLNGKTQQQGRMNAFVAGLSFSWRNPLLPRSPGIGCSTTNLQQRLGQTFFGTRCTLNGWSATLSVICSNCSIPSTPCPCPCPSKSRVKKKVI